MKDENEVVLNRLQAIRKMNKIHLAHLLNFIKNNPEKYPDNVNEWLEWMSKESENRVDEFYDK